MAMLECYEPSLVGWRILSRKADAFMTVDEDDAKEAMWRLAHPVAGDPARVAGESGYAGLAGLCAVAADRDLCQATRLDANARVLLINTEGATDRKRYEAIVGAKPESILVDHVSEFRQHSGDEARSKRPSLRLSVNDEAIHFP